MQLSRRMSFFTSATLKATWPNHTPSIDIASFLPSFLFQLLGFRIQIASANDWFSHIAPVVLSPKNRFADSSAPVES